MEFFITNVQKALWNDLKYLFHLSNILLFLPRLKLKRMV